MKNRTIHGVFLLLSMTSCVCQASIPAASTAVPALKAIVPADNDITPDKDNRPGTLPVPAAVEEKLSKIVDDAYQWYATKDQDCIKSKEDCGLDKTSMYGRIYALKTPTKNQAYVFVLNALSGVTQYYFVLYNPDTHKATDKPISIYGKWLDGFYADNDVALLERPFVSFTQISGKPVLKVEDYGHNGTLYNAALYRYFQMGDDLSLTPVLAVEERSLWPGDIYGFNGMITRKLEFTGQHTARISAYFVSDTGDKTPRLLGMVDIENADGPFHIVKKTVVDKRFDPGLLTLSETDESKFLVSGDGLFY